MTRKIHIFYCEGWRRLLDKLLPIFGALSILRIVSLTFFPRSHHHTLSKNINCFRNEFGFLCPLLLVYEFDFKSRDEAARRLFERT